MEPSHVRCTLPPCTPTQSVSWGFCCLLQKQLLLHIKLKGCALHYLDQKLILGKLGFEHVPKKQRLQLLVPSPVSRIFWGLSAVQSFLHHTLQTEHKAHHGQPWHTPLSASGCRLPCAAIMELNVEFAYKFSWWVMNNTTLFH